MSPQKCGGHITTSVMWSNANNIFATTLASFHGNIQNLTICERNKEKSTFSKEEVIDFIKKRYLSQSTLDTLVGLKALPLERIYTRLAIIGNEEREEQKNELKARTFEDERQKSYETLHKAKEPIELEELFEHEEVKKKKKVVVYGSAGIGKTASTHNIVYKWAKGDLWPQFKTIFRLKFRDINKRNFSERNTTYDLLLDSCGFKSEEVKQELFDEEFRKKCLVILDGYDELASESWEIETFNREKLKIVEAFEKDFEHLLITTRPQRVVGIHSPAQLEILGFDEEGVKKYVDQLFQKEENDTIEEEKKKNRGKTQVLKQLEKPIIKSLCFIPINLEIFCSLSLEGKTFDLDTVTMTLIYDQLTNWLIRRYQLDRMGKSRHNTEEEGFPKEDKELEPVMTVLETFAWKAMEANALYVNTQDRVTSRLLKSHGLEYDGVTKVGPFRIHEGEGHFIHLTFQEFFAARHLVKVFEKDQAQFEKVIGKIKYHPRYRLVIRMLAGLLSEEEKSEEFFKVLLAEPRDKTKTSELVVIAQCFEECKSLEPVKKEHDAFINRVLEFLEDKSIMYELKVDLLNGNYRLLHHPKIVDELVSKVKRYGSDILEILEELARKGNHLGDRVIHELEALLNNPNVEYRAKSNAARALGEIAKGGQTLSKKALEGLGELLLDPKADYFTKSSAAYALGEVVKGGHILPEKAMEGLVELLLDPNTDPFAERSAAHALGEVVKGGYIHPEKTIQMLKTVLHNHKADCKAKNSASRAQGEVPKGGHSHSEKAVKGLSAFSLDPKTDYDAISYDVDALGEVAKGGFIHSEKAVERLEAFLIDPNTDFRAKISAARALGEVAKGGHALSEKAMEMLGAFPLNPMVDYDAKTSVAYALREVAIGGHALSEKAMEKLVAFLIDPNADYRAKNSAAHALGEVAKGGHTYSEKAIQRLITVLCNRKADYNVKSFAAHVLGEVAKGGHTHSEKAMEALVVFFHNPEADFDIKSSLARALGEVAKGGHTYSEKAMEMLSAIFLDPKADSYAKRIALSVFQAKDLSLFASIKNNEFLIEGCRLSGIIVYEMDEKYFICDSGKQVESQIQTHK